MDGQTGILLVGGLASLAQVGVGCFNRRKAKKLYKARLSSLILSKKTGKTQLKKHLQSLTSDLVIIDMNEVIKDAADDLDFMVKGKEYIDGLLIKFKKKRFLLLLESKEQSEYLRVDINNSFVITPCIELFRKILASIDNPILKSDVEKARLALIKDTESDKLNIFETFDELYGVLKRLYKLQSTF